MSDPSSSVSAMTSAQSFQRRSRQYSDRLISAVHSAKQHDPLAPVTVLCGPGAVDDVTAALAQSDTPFVNVEVQPLNVFIHSAAASLNRPRMQRGDVAAEVAAVLQPDAPAPTVFHDKGLNGSAATLEGLTDAVYTLSTYPPTWREMHGDSELPRVVAKLAHDILNHLQEQRYTFPEAVTAAAAAAAARQIVVVGDIALDPLSEWALEQIAPDASVVAEDGFAGEMERRSFVAEQDEAKYVAGAVANAIQSGAQLHELAVGYCDETALPYLVRAFEEAGISFAAPATRVWAQNEFFRTLSLLLRVDPAEMNRRDLSALLSTGTMNPKDGPEEGEASPWIVHFDQVTRNSEQQFYAGENWQAAEIADGYLKDQTTEVVAWVNALAEELRGVWGSPNWRALSNQLRRLTGKWLRAPRAEETVYAEEFFRTLERQHGPVSRERAVDAVSPLFDRSQPAESRGLVRIGPLESLAGRNLRTAFIVGALDDALPGSLTPSATIAETQSHLTPEAFIDTRRRALEAALRSAEKVVITHPRSHQDGSGRTQPSQWVSKDELERQGTLTTAAEKDGIASMPPVSTLLRTGELAPLTGADLSLIRTAHGKVEEGVRRYRDIMSYRDAGAHGDQEGAEFNGYTHSDIGASFLEKQISNSALELFTESPQFFFIQRVLGKYQLEDRVHTLDMDARERGTLYHEIFERWTEEVLLRGASPDPAWWDGEGRRALDAIVTETLEKHRSARVNEAVWKGVQSGVWRDIGRWYAKEREEYAEGWRPIAAELAFGSSNRDGEEHPAPALRVPTGANTSTPMSFRGFIDRVDYRVVKPTLGTDDFEPYTEIRITDYKTGKKHTDVAAALEKSATGDPEKKHYFQLALYGWAVHHRFVDDPDPEAQSWFPEIAAALRGLPPVKAVHSRYWYFQAPKDEDGQPTLTINDKVTETLTTNLANIYQYVAAGIFPPRPLPRTQWTNDMELRIGRAQYTAVTEALSELGLAPLSITTPFSTDTELNTGKELNTDTEFDDTAHAEG